MESTSFEEMRVTLYRNSWKTRGYDQEENNQLYGLPSQNEW